MTAIHSPFPPLATPDDVRPYEYAERSAGLAFGYPALPWQMEEQALDGSVWANVHTLNIQTFHLGEFLGKPSLVTQAKDGMVMAWIGFDHEGVKVCEHWVRIDHLAPELQALWYAAAEARGRIPAWLLGEEPAPQRSKAKAAAAPTRARRLAAPQLTLFEVR